MAEQQKTWRQRTSEGTTTYVVAPVLVSTLKLGDLVLESTPERSTYLGRVRRIAAEDVREMTWLKWEDDSFIGLLYPDQTVWKATKLT